jgi:predicted phosphoadenosine phosphosulfate sulfurtransferase
MNNKKPHIVKFSGGRSSAMTLMKLLENNQLNPKRGDVIIFNNTSAEHSATYEFTRKIKKIAEKKYNIPFFWIEYRQNCFFLTNAQLLTNAFLDNKISSGTPPPFFL